MSYGKLNFIVQRAAAKAAQGKTRLSSLAPHHLPYLEGVPQHPWYCHTQSGKLGFGHLPCFHEHRSPFPPSTTPSCLSSAPYHGPGFHRVGFWDQSWGLWQSHAPWRARSSWGWQKLRASPLQCLGCWDTRGDGVSGSSASCLGTDPQQVVPLSMLSLLAGKMGGTVSWRRDL